MFKLAGGSILIISNEYAEELHTIAKIAVPGPKA